MCEITRAPMMRSVSFATIGVVFAISTVFGSASSAKPPVNAAEHPENTTDSVGSNQRESLKTTVVAPTQWLTDLGAVAGGAKATGTVTLRNHGDSPISIRRVKASCSCTATSYPESAIPPGGIVEIQVEVEAPREPGQSLTPKVTILFEGDAAPPAEALLLIRSKPVVEAKVVDLAVSDTSMTLHVRLNSTDGHTFQAIHVPGWSQSDPANEFVVPVTLERDAEGRYSRRIGIRLDHSDQRLVEIALDESLERLSIESASSIEFKRQERLAILSARRLDGLPPGIEQRVNVYVPAWCEGSNPILEVTPSDAPEVRVVASAIDEEMLWLTLGITATHQTAPRGSMSIRILDQEIESRVRFRYRTATQDGS